MPQRLVHVAAFADRPFTGNPAAVCVLAGPADPEWMQALARELNLSETAFPASSAPARFHPRSGGLTAWRTRDWIETDSPKEPPASIPPPEGLAVLESVRR